MIYIFKNRDLILLFIANFLFFFNEMLLMPTLPLYLSEMNYSYIELGAVIGAFALGVLSFRPLAGKLTDRKGRKPSLVTGLVIFTIVPPFYLVSDTFLWLLFIRFVHGIGLTFFTTASPTITADIAPSHRRGEILGHMSIGSTLSQALAPWFGIFIFTNFGMVYALLLCSILGFVGLILSLMIREPEALKSARKPSSYKKAVWKRVVFIPSVVVLIEAMIFGSIFTFLPILLVNELQINAGVFFLVSAITIILCRIFVSHLSDLYGRGPIFFYSYLVGLISVLLIAGVHSLTILLVAALLYGIGSAISLPALTALLVDSCEAHERGTVFSFFYGAYDIGVLSAGVSLGLVADLFNLRFMFVSIFVVGLLSALFFMLTIQPTYVRSIQWTTIGKSKRAYHNN